MREEQNELVGRTYNLKTMAFGSGSNAMYLSLNLLFA